MKYLFLSGLVCFFSLQSSSQVKETIVSINGVVKNLEPGDSILRIELKKVNLDTRTEIIIDSTSLINQLSFSFAKRKVQPGYYRIGYKGKRSSLSNLLLLDEGIHQVKVIIDTFQFTASGKAPSIYPKIKITGVVDNEKLDSFFSVTTNFYRTVESPLKKRLAELEELLNKESERDSLNTILKIKKTELEKRKKRLIEKYMGTSIAVYQTMNEWDNSDYIFIDEVVGKFKKAKPNSFITPLIEQKAQSLKNASLIMKSATDFSLLNQDNQEVSLKSILGKEIILLDFWASWCGPCLKEMPFLKSMYERYHKKGFSIIGISTDTDISFWKQTLIKQQLPWINLIDKRDAKGSAAKKYGIFYLPTNFLIDKNGTIIKKDISHYDLEKYLLENTQ